MHGQSFCQRVNVLRITVNQIPVSINCLLKVYLKAINSITYIVFHDKRKSALINDVEPERLIPYWCLPAIRRSSRLELLIADNDSAVWVLSPEPLHVLQSGREF